MSNNHLEAHRQAFEQHVRDSTAGEWTLGLMDCGKYQDLEIEYAYQTWCAALAYITENPPWQDISTAPKDGSLLVFINSSGHEYYGRWLWSGNARIYAWCGDSEGIILPFNPQPTLWKFPTPPAAKE